jgi:hypothetical protein
VTSWDFRRWLWAPWLGCYGIQRLTLLHNVLALRAPVSLADGSPSPA